MQIGDPFTGKKLIEASVELVSVGPRRVAPGLRRRGDRVVALRDGRRLRHRRPPRPRAAARGGDGALGGDDLREPGADGRDRPPADARGGRGGARPLGARARGDRRGHRHRRAARVLGRGGRRRDPRAAPHRRVPALRGRAASARAAPRRARDRRRARRRATRSSSCSPRRRCGAASSSSGRYDQLVGSRTVRRPGLDAAVLRLRPSLRGLALSLDGQGRIARLDPFTGGALAVLEAARNVACVGGEPIGFTDCLNFGNPEKPEIGWELAAGDRRHRRGVRGARRAGRLRQRLALQRDERPRDPSDAGRRRGRSRRGRAARAEGLAGRAT